MTTDDDGSGGGRPGPAGRHPEDPPPVDRLQRAREAVIETHADVLAATLESLDAAIADLPEPVTDGRVLAGALERELRDAGLLDRYVAVLRTAVAAANLSLSASPVPAPPYVTVTSRGPVLRGPMENGRLVLTVAAVAVERAPVRYVRAPGTAADALRVSFRS